MKRHPALHPLSHQHRNFLSVALSLRRAGTPSAQLSPVEAAHRFARYWEDEGRNHLRLEEEVLLPYCSDHLDMNEEKFVKLLQDHISLRRLALALLKDVAEMEDKGDLALDRLHHLADLIEQHIRHEEREVFPVIQEQVPEDVLSRMNEELPQDTGLPG